MPPRGGVESLGRCLVADWAWAGDAYLIAKSGAGRGAVRIRSTDHEDPDPDEPAGVHRHRP